MTRLLFLGDSVTDCARKRAKRYEQTIQGLGSGWVAKLEPTLSARNPETVIFNRGFSGCLTKDLSSQEDWWPESLPQLRADVCTLMIGINDVWHPFWKNKPHDIAAVVDAFEQLLTTVVPKVSNMLVLEPVALPVGDVDQHWWPLLDELTLGQEKVAKQVGAIWVPLQDDLIKDAGSRPSQYLSDGVHPTELGHHWLAKRWLRAVSENNLIR